MQYFLPNRGISRDSTRNADRNKLQRYGKMKTEASIHEVTSTLPLSSNQRNRVKNLEPLYESEKPRNDLMTPSK